MNSFHLWLKGTLSLRYLKCCTLSTCSLMHRKPSFLLWSCGKHIHSIYDWREPQAKIFEVFYGFKCLIKTHGLSLLWVFKSITFVLDQLTLNLLFIQKVLSMLINFWSSSANCTTSSTQCAEIKLECGRRQWIVSKYDIQDSRTCSWQSMHSRQVSLYTPQRPISHWRERE